jgi:hypothetical protein
MSKDASGSFNDEAERRELKADYTLYQKSAAACAFARESVRVNDMHNLSSAYSNV